MRLPFGTWGVGVMHGVREHMGARTAPPPPLEWMEYGPARGPITRGALPPGVFPLALGALGSCMGLEGTCGPVLHPPPPRGMDGIWPRSGANVEGCAPTGRLPLGTRGIGVMHVVRGHMWARTAPIPLIPPSTSFSYPRAPLVAGVQPPYAPLPPTPIGPTTAFVAPCRCAWPPS